VSLLLSQENLQNTVLRKWALARLIAWVFLDQRAGRRGIKTRKARCAGHLILMDAINTSLAKSERDNGELELMFALFIQSGGFDLAKNTPSAKSMLSQFIAATKATEAVFEIVNHLCRIKIHGHQVRSQSPAAAKDPFTIDSAKQLVANNADTRGNSAMSRISKTWEKYKASAPFIYALHSHMRRFKTAEPDKAASWIQRAATNQKRMLRILGAAAYAADVLNECGARRVRMHHVKKVKRVVPQCRPFTDEEINLVIGTLVEAALA